MIYDINDDKITFPKGNPVDPFGKVFFKDDNVYRAVSIGYGEFCKEILSSYLLKELMEKGLFPKTKIANFDIGGFDFVLQHEKVIYTQPSEWTFEMLKDVAMSILEINNICKKHGFCLKDAHPWNVAFKFNRPIFLDFGSMVKADTNYEESFLREFRDTIWYPLLLWTRGEDLIAQALLSHPYNMYKFTIPKATLSDSNIMKSIVGSFDGKTDINIDNIKELTLKNSRDTMWSEYQSEFFSEIDNKRFCERFGRFNRILELLKKFSSESETIVDIAGNMGAMSYYLEEKSNFKKILNIDYDENAIDFFYQKLKNTDYKIETYLANFMMPKQQDIYENFKSDVVLALAVTHHLVLSQNFSLDYIFNKINLFSKKYVYVEFMPLGLWGGGDLPEIPTWYTMDWFRGEFEKKFELLHVEKLEKNRILFIGKK